MIANFFVFKPRILILGMPEGCCQKIHQKIHIDSLIDAIANSCQKIERLEIRWDPETMRFSDRSNKAVGKYSVLDYD